jgi:glucose-1-phosphate cytidylyltransferase
MVHVKTVILAGGRGTRLSEETHAMPKPMVAIGGRPILWHIMSHYAAHGHTDFVVALGYKGAQIKEYFANYFVHDRDFAVDLRTGRLSFHSEAGLDWQVTLVDTGLDSMTGGRVGRLRDHLTERFMLTYGDGLSDVDLGALLARHAAAGVAGTVTAVHPPPRFGALSVEDGNVVSFQEKSLDSVDRINGGFMVLEPEVIDLVESDDTVLETTVLGALASAGQLAAFEHDGFWQPMDTLRERDVLEDLWQSGNPPWVAR